MQLSDLSLRLHALSVLRGVLRLPLVNAYAETLSAFDRSAADFADRYGALCARHASPAAIFPAPF